MSINVKLSKPDEVATKIWKEGFLVGMFFGTVIVGIIVLLVVG